MLGELGLVNGTKVFHEKIIVGSCVSLLIQVWQSECVVPMLVIADIMIL